MSKNENGPDSEVAEMQVMLNSLGYNCGTVDGIMGPATKASETRLQNERTVYLVLKEAGLKDAAIAGVMGNIQAESSFRTELSGYGGAGGICQWEGSRLERLKEYAYEMGLEETDIRLQADFLALELTPYSSKYDRACMNLLELLRGMEDNEGNAQMAADYFNALFERNRNKPTWEEVISECEKCGWAIHRFSKKPNAYNNRFYLDAPKRRGAAKAFYYKMKNLYEEREEEEKW
ncbi:MAG: hypothetical protein J5811_04000 [Lachnospiraceae bacterium]|nr:hypothetical protein [Lachnospiraceae bacterium]